MFPSSLTWLWADGLSSSPPGPLHRLCLSRGIWPPRSEDPRQEKVRAETRSFYSCGQILFASQTHPGTTWEETEQGPVHQKAGIAGAVSEAASHHIPGLKCFTGRAVGGYVSGHKILTMTDIFWKPWRVLWGPTGIMNRSERTLLRLFTECNLEKTYIKNNRDYPR